MKHLIKLIMCNVILSVWLVCVASGQNRFKELADSAARQTDIELFGTDNPTMNDIERAIKKAKYKNNCDCDWIVERFEKYTMQLDSGKITVRDLKSYILDIKILIEMKRIASNGKN